MRRIITGAVSVSHDPNEALVIHGDGVLVRRPLISRTALATPSLDEVASVVKLHHGRRGHGSCVWRRGPGTHKSVWATKDPYVIARIDCDRRPKSHLPLCRHLWPRGILLELRQSALSYMRSLCRRRLAENRWKQTRDHPEQKDSAQDETDQHGALHEFSPQQLRGGYEIQRVDATTLGPDFLQGCTLFSDCPS